MKRHTHDEALRSFVEQNAFRGKGPLCVGLVVTQHAREFGLPLLPESLITAGGGQVLGLGRSSVQSILSRYGITRILASEGGRTSRGSMRNMREYVLFLNDMADRVAIDLDAIERFWIDRVHEFFAAKPFKLTLDTSRSLRVVIRDLIGQAVERQKASSGTHYSGAVLQHLVGAKLDCALGMGAVTHNSFSTADLASSRDGDFGLGDVAIHVTTSPGEAVIGRCRENLNDGIRPIIVTLQPGLAVAEGLAGNVGLAARIDVFEIEQFIALNLYELGKFAEKGRRTAITDLVRRYNEIVEEFETDPSLRIDLRS